MRTRDHLRSNVVGYVALFAFAMGGVAEALPGKNTIDSGDIKNGQVKTKDLNANAVKGNRVKDGTLSGADVADGSIAGVDVDSGQIQLRIGNGCDAGSAISAVGADGTVSCLNVPAGATGPAGGDLTGSYPAPTLAPNSIGSAESEAAHDEILDGSIDGQDIDEGTLELVCQGFSGSVQSFHKGYCIQDPGPDATWANAAINCESQGMRLPTPGEAYALSDAPIAYITTWTDGLVTTTSAFMVLEGTQSPILTTSAIDTARNYVCVYVRPIPQISG